MKPNDIIVINIKGSGSRKELQSLLKVLRIAIVKSGKDELPFGWDSFPDFEVDIAGYTQKDLKR